MTSAGQAAMPAGRVLGVFSAAIGLLAVFVSLLPRRVVFHGELGPVRTMTPPDFRPSAVLLGPVVGRVDSTTARVLVELLRDGAEARRGARCAQPRQTVHASEPHRTRCVRTSLCACRPRAAAAARRRSMRGCAKEHPSLSTSRCATVRERQPTVLIPSAQDLRPGTAYSITVLLGGAIEARGSLRTLPARGWNWTAPAAPVRFAVVSCNHLWYTDTHVPPEVSKCAGVPALTAAPS
jgi:hypothetical protein